MTSCVTMSVPQLEDFVDLINYPKRQRLPVTICVLSDLGGVSQRNSTPLTDRKPIEVSLDNFDAVMKTVAPHLGLGVKNLLGGGGRLAVNLEFECLADFQLRSIAFKSEPLKFLLEEWHHKTRSGFATNN